MIKTAIFLGLLTDQALVTYYLPTPAMRIGFIVLNAVIFGLVTQLSAPRRNLTGTGRIGFPVTKA
jgi:hypothetical protein